MAGVITENTHYKYFVNFEAIPSSDDLKEGRHDAEDTDIGQCLPKSWNVVLHICKYHGKAV